VISPCGSSASGTTEPSGSSGEIAPRVIARPKTSATADFAIDQLWYLVSRVTGAAESSPTRHPCRYTRIANDEFCWPYAIAAWSFAPSIPASAGATARQSPSPGSSQCTAAPAAPGRAARASAASGAAMDVLRRESTVN
jgi:hypothetical protein